MKAFRWSALVFAFASMPALGWADVVTLKDGSRLVGEITTVADGKLKLKTEFAGELTIELGKVADFATDETLRVRVEDGNVLSGKVTNPAEGQLRVETPNGALTVPATSVKTAWRPTETDPEEAARVAAVEGQLRKWAYEAAVNLLGKDGNSEEFGLAANMKATLEGPDDRLEVYGSYNYSERGNEANTDETIAGVRYTNFFGNQLGWYVRQEVERDEFENLDFRSISAGGLSYRFINNEKMRLEGRSGLSYRYETYQDILQLNPDGSAVRDPDGNKVYTDGGEEGFFGLDFGLTFFWRFAEWGEMNTELTYLPSIEDFGDYRATHATNVDFPLAISDRWKLRVGLSNDYNSKPAANREELDTTYYLALLLNWK